MMTPPQQIGVIVIFSIYGQFGTMRKPDSERKDCKCCIFINSNLLSHSAIFAKKMLIFSNKNAGISKIKGFWY